jgi:hypothetical protein
MNLLRQIKTVLWSFVGLGQRKDMADIHQRGKRTSTSEAIRWC